MLKKFTLVFLCFLAANGYVFSQEKNAEIIFPKNTIMLDAGLITSSLITWSIVGNPVFNAAIQYERQFSNILSAALRLEYRLMDFSSNIGSPANLSSFSAEAHGRYYPTGNIFFLNAMLGYAFFNYKVEPSNLMSHYFKLGGKLGWRIDFGKPGGFVFEPSFGYYGAIGDSNINIVEEIDDATSFFNDLLNLMYSYLIKGYFVGGPQFALAVGYRF